MEPSVLEARFAKNYESILQTIEEACQRVGRSQKDITLIAVTKYVDETAVSPLLNLGIRHFGENRWQQARPKLAHERADEAVWHFIGHLQGNKVKDVVRHFEWIHSVHSLELAAEIHRVAEREQKQVKCLVQVNISGEETKSGISEEESFAFFERARHFSNITFCGLMTMARATENPEEAREVFRRLRGLRDRLRHETDIVTLQELSMGMSNDYPVAIEEGATMIRIGRNLVG